MYRGFIIPLILGFIVIEVVLMIMKQFMAAVIISVVVLAAVLSVSFFRRAPPPRAPTPQKLAKNQPNDPTFLYNDPSNTVSATPVPNYAPPGSSNFATNRLLSATI